MMITKSQILNYARVGVRMECECELKELSDKLIYSILSCTLSQSYDSECYDALNLKLTDGLMAHSLTLPNKYFDVKGLFEKINKRQHYWGVKNPWYTETETSMEFPTKTTRFTSIESIQYNEKKHITTVVFKDGDVQMSKLSDEDHYDSYIGVALCIAAHEFGSKTAFKKYVDSHIKMKGSKK